MSGERDLWKEWKQRYQQHSSAVARDRSQYLADGRRVAGTAKTKRRSKRRVVAKRRTSHTSRVANNNGSNGSRCASAAAPSGHKKAKTQSWTTVISNATRPKPRMSLDFYRQRALGEQQHQRGRAKASALSPGSIKNGWLKLVATHCTTGDGEKQVQAHATSEESADGAGTAEKFPPDGEQNGNKHNKPESDEDDQGSNASVAAPPPTPETTTIHISFPVPDTGRQLRWELAAEDKRTSHQQRPPQAPVIMHRRATSTSTELSVSARQKVRNKQVVKRTRKGGGRGKKQQKRTFKHQKQPPKAYQEEVILEDVLQQVAEAEEKQQRAQQKHKAEAEMLACSILGPFGVVETVEEDATVEPQKSTAKTVPSKPKIPMYITSIATSTWANMTQTEQANARAEIKRLLVEHADDPDARIKSEIDPLIAAAGSAAKACKAKLAHAAALRRKVTTEYHAKLSAKAKTFRSKKKKIKKSKQPPCATKQARNAVLLLRGSVTR